MRDFVYKLESGEYLYKYKKFDPSLIKGISSYNLNIGEEKYYHCVGGFYGIGDVEWWIKDELNKLIKEEKEELIFICKYKTYIDKFITRDLIKDLALFFKCETFHIYRTGTPEIIKLLNQLSNYHNLIFNKSDRCNSNETLNFKNSIDRFKLKSFDEFKYEYRLKHNKPLNRFNNIHMTDKEKIFEIMYEIYSKENKTTKDEFYNSFLKQEPLSDEYSILWFKAKDQLITETF